MISDGQRLFVFCSIVAILSSCASTSSGTRPSEIELNNSIGRQKTNTPESHNDQLSIAEYGPASMFLGTWEITGRYFLDLEPEGLFRLKNFFMAGDPDPNYWYQQGYWYVQDHQIVLEHTISRNAKIIPSEFNQSTTKVTVARFDSNEGDVNLQFGDLKLKKIENLGPNQVQNYRLNRSRSTSNPVEMAIDDPSTAKRLKLVAAFWGYWEANGEVALSFSPTGQFLAYKIEPNMGKNGWVFTGKWFVEGDSVVLNAEHRTGNKLVPDLFLKPKILLNIVSIESTVSLIFDLGNMKFSRKIEE